MIEKSTRDAMQKILDLNDGCPENTDIYAFPLDTVIFNALMHYLKDFETAIFIPKIKDSAEDENDCAYAIARTKNDDHGYSLFVFVTDVDLDKCIEAVKIAMTGEDPE